MHEPHINYNPNSGDPNAPTNPRLLAAMHGVARNDNPETRLELYSALLDSTLLLPLPPPPEGHAPGFVTPDENTPLNLIMLQDAGGRVVLPAFTDTTALMAWDSSGFSYVGLSAPLLLTTAYEEQISAVVLNVAGPTGGEISQSEIAILAQGALPQGDNAYAFPADTPLLVSYPDPMPPDSLLSQLHRSLASHPEIASAHLVKVVLPNGEPHLLVGVAFNDVQDDNVIVAAMQDLVATVQGAVPVDIMLDFMVLAGDALSGSILSSGVHIYQVGL
ncbi:MAG: enhanced serine sensitivity protein SseB C-terminal domain-containing protein [Chloroflexota bacterium]